MRIGRGLLVLLVEITGTVQHESWLNKVLPPVEEVRPDLFSIPVPIPHSPLRYVSVYALTNEAGVTIVDAGWDNDDSWLALLDGLSTIGVSITDVRGVLVTHKHFDHIGLAGRVREESGAWVGLHPADQSPKDLDSRDPATWRKATLDWFVSLGASAEEAATMIEEAVGDGPLRASPLPDRLIEDDEIIHVPGWDLRAVHTPGHTPGHLCFLDEDGRTLFAGDHLLPRITPNISAERGTEMDPLGDFLESLDKVSKFDVDEVLPAHEWRYRGLEDRIAQLKLHHEHRLAELLSVIRRQPGITPWDMAAALTWSRPWDQFNGYIRVSAVAETMSHVIHLESRGLVVSTAKRELGYMSVSD
jgi:glyoxylase-like metal-dependent hydrolase (beta-lactamase superfamily II)